METKDEPKQNENITLDKKSKILFLVVGLLITGSVVVTFWRYMMKRDYIVQAQTDCDPETEKCFVWECDPASTVEGEACTGDEESDIWYYKIIHRNAQNIPLCDPNDENCTALVCDPGEKDCLEELCSEKNVPEGETCNDPEQYLIDNPPEEECAEDDEECLAEQEAVECEEDDEECLDEQEAVECEEDDEECLSEESANEECTPDDQECLDTQSSDETTCAPDDQECLDVEDTEETCAPDDQTCDQTQDSTTSPDDLDSVTP